MWYLFDETDGKFITLDYEPEAGDLGVQSIICDNGSICDKYFREWLDSVPTDTMSTLKHWVYKRDIGVFNIDIGYYELNSTFICEHQYMKDLKKYRLKVDNWTFNDIPREIIKQLRNRKLKELGL